MRNGYTRHEQPMTVGKLAALTAGLGDWWDQVTPMVEDMEFGACEYCDWHPMRQREADRINRLLKLIRGAGGGSPFAAYNHCREEVFIEWAGDHGKRIAVTFLPGEKADVMVTTPDTCDFWDLDESEVTG